MFMNMFLIDFPAVEDEDSSATETLLMPNENKLILTIFLQLITN